jgi:hypothetical protein
MHVFVSSLSIGLVRVFPLTRRTRKQPRGLAENPAYRQRTTWNVPLLHVAMRKSVSHTGASDDITKSSKFVFLPNRKLLQKPMKG